MASFISSLKELQTSMRTNKVPDHSHKAEFYSLEGGNRNFASVVKQLDTIRDNIRVLVKNAGLTYEGEE